MVPGAVSTVPMTEDDHDNSACPALDPRTGPVRDCRRDRADGAATRHARRAAADIPRLVFEKYHAPNGLDVILSEDKRLPMVAVSLWYHVGPANE